MKSSYFWRRAVVLAALALAFAGTAIAQVGTGNLYGTVVDEQGAPLPGVTLELSGQGAPQVQVTDSQGAFRFPALSPGEHSLKASLDGFSTTELPRVVIGVNRNTSLEITMASAAAVQEVITVTAETPLLDERKTQLGATYTSMELEKIPTARDPWAMIQSTPGVLTDRINVGGNESGQQSNYTGPGAQGDQSIWSIDGMVITDMAAIGSSPGYYDFDSFEEVQVGTGGSETTTAAPGVVLNIVTKRGTNEWRGSARYLLTDDSWQSDLDFDQSELAGANHFNASTANPGGNAQRTFKQGNRIVEITDMGLEVGGPIVKDKLWVWGSYADQQIDLLTISDFPDASTLEGYNFKVNAQITPNNSATGFIWQSDKVKIGRNAGPTRPPETTWDQDGYGDWPSAGKLEDTHIFSSNFYLTGMYSRVNGGFQLRPQGGDKFFSLDTGSVWHHSFFDIYPIDRPQEQFKADASNFFNTGSVSHELKYGAGYRTAEQFTISKNPAGGWEINLGGGYSYVILSSDSILATKAEYTNIYAQDTLSVGNLTVNFGLRYDEQTGNNPAVSVPASLTNPTARLAGDTHNPGLPATTYPGADAGFTWESIVPRLGLSYALGEEKKTILRASYSRFADQLANGVIGQVNPNYPQRYTYWIGYYGGNGVFNPANLLYQYALGPNVNPLTGGLLISSGVDPNLDPPMTDEILLGIEHALLPEFVVGLQGTYRHTTDLLELETLVFDGDAFAASNLNSIGRLNRRDDFIVTNTLTGTLPDGTPYALPVWDLRPGVTTRRGTFLENGDREWDYLGLAVTATKRLSNRWMMRGNFTWNDWTWDVPDSELENPSIIANTGLDGQEVITGAGIVSGAKGNVWIQSSYSYSFNALYQVAPDRPWGFNIATNITGREGYPRQFIRRTATAWNGNRTDLRILDDATEYRHEDITTFDARVEKEFTFNDFNLTLGIDGFNLLNDATVLQRQSLRGFSTLTGVGGDHVTEILSPRVFRIGARISFR